MNLDKIAATYAIVLCLLTAIATFCALIYQLIFGVWEWLPVTFALHLISVIGHTAICRDQRPDAQILGIENFQTCTATRATMSPRSTVCGA